MAGLIPSRSSRSHPAAGIESPRALRCPAVPVWHIKHRPRAHAAGHTEGSGVLSAGGVAARALVIDAGGLLLATLRSAQNDDAASLVTRACSGGPSGSYQTMPDGTWNSNSAGA